MVSDLGIHQHLITKSIPRGNGQIERYVTIVLNMLRVKISNKPE